MGKILLCSGKSDFDAIKNKFQEFPQTFSTDAYGVYLSVYDKLRMHVENFFSSGEDYAVGVGTFIYKNRKGRDALELVFHDFHGDVSSVQDILIGSYCIAICKKGSLVLFIDAASTYNIYFYLKSGDFILTNTFSHIVQRIGIDNAKINKVKFFEFWIKKSILEEKTPFDEVKKLSGNKYLCYNAGRWSLRDISGSEKRSNSDINKDAKEMYSSLSGLFNDSALFITGGQDSRMTLSLMLAIGMQPVLLYGEGDSNDTATRSDDYVIVQRIAEQYSLPFRKMNWNDSDTDGMEYYIDKYGELFNLYYMNKNIINEFEKNINTELLCFGYFGEVYRTVESIDAYTKSFFTLDEYIEDLYIQQLHKLFKEDFYHEIFKDVKKELTCFCQQCGINPDCISKDEFQKLNTVYRQTWDTEMNNFANQFFYSFPLFGDIHLTHYGDVIPYENKKNSQYQMLCMDNFYPGIVNIPFFSHMKVKKYDMSLHQLTDAELVSRVKDRIRELITTPLLMRIARYIYYAVRGDKKAQLETENELKSKGRMISQVDKLIFSDCLDIHGSYNVLSVRLLKDYINFDYMVHYLAKEKP